MDSPARLLVIRRDNIGDLVCATPLIAALRRRYPRAHIAALVNSYNAAVLHGNPDLDAVHAYTKLKHRAPEQSWLGIALARFRLLADLRRQRFDYVVLAKTEFDRHGLALARRIAPRHIVGVAPPGERRAKAITVPVSPIPFGEVHEVEAMMRLAAALDVQEPPGPLRVFPAPEAVKRWTERFPALRERRDRRWIALHISARGPRKLWPVEHFLALMRTITRDKKFGIVLLWAPGAADNPRHPGDDARAAAIATRVGAEMMLIPAKTASLEDLTAVLSLCDAFIGADGGAMHIAAALGVPIVALFENFPHKKRHWHPWQVPYEMVSPDTRDITDITIDQVAQAWSRLAARLGTPAPSGAAARAPRAH